LSRNLPHIGITTATKACPNHGSSLSSVLAGELFSEKAEKHLSRAKFTQARFFGFASE
jgi:hypothetical protein